MLLLLPELISAMILCSAAGDSGSAFSFRTSFLSKSRKQRLTQYLSLNSRLIYLMQHIINNGSIIPAKTFSLMFTLLRSKRAAAAVFTAVLKKRDVGWLI